MENFENHYRFANILLIDNIQFFVNK
ncbi:hypothetical protein [Blochmannia endosymbiont of Camponotus (Colobopsis) obliquus]